MGKRHIRVAATAGTALALVATVATVVLTASTPAAAATSTFIPVADTYVQSDTPSTNYGTSNQVVVDNAPVRRTSLKFTVTGVSGQVTSAKLRLRTISDNNGSNNGGTFKS